jgi:TRAP-type C4-dicarboxylate transport system substrate-binding protein
MKKQIFILALGLIVIAGLMAAGQPCMADQTAYNLKMQTHLIPSQMARTFPSLEQDIATASTGSIIVKLFPVGAIVPYKEVLDAVGRKTLDMAFFPEGAWYKTIPVSAIGMGIPYALTSLDQAREFMFKKGYVDLLRKGYEKHNVHIFPIEPFSVGLMTKKPVEKVSDLKGMKLRGTGTMADFLGKLGASTTVIPGGELYTALATGVVQGAHWGDAGPMFEMKFHEVLKNYMSPDPIIGAWNCVMINAEIWKSMSPEQQKTLETVIYKAGDIAFAGTRALTASSLGEMQSKWQVKVVALPEAEVALMKKASAELQAEYAKQDELTAKAITMLEEMQKVSGK